MGLLQLAGSAAQTRSAAQREWRKRLLCVALRRGNPERKSANAVASRKFKHRFA